jgi:predicted RNA-binding Zn-ribbon protein involved in translation (DUF1610 family)
MDRAETLEVTAQAVIATMSSLHELAGLSIDELRAIPLGRLRRDATRLHAVCRYRKGIRKADIQGPADVQCVDLHPAALEGDWRRYAMFLLYHEYLHALGFAGHDRTFRRLEALWPDTEARAMGPAFGTHLRTRAAKWLWTCPQCGIEHPRSRRSNGRYRCRVCQVILVDAARDNA